MSCRKKIIILLIWVLCLQFHSGNQLLAQFNSFTGSNNTVPLTEKNIMRIEGNYPILPRNCFDELGNFIDLLISKKYHNIVYLVSDGEKQIDYQNIDRMEIRAFDASEVIITFWQTESIISRAVLKGELRKDGYFYLLERYKNSMGIPYLFGGKYQYESRIGLSSAGELVLQTAMKNKGALLIFIKKNHEINRIYRFSKSRKTTKA